MTRFEWKRTLEKARDLAAGNDRTCYNMFCFLLEGVNSLPIMFPHEERTEEEEEDE